MVIINLACSVICYQLAKEKRRNRFFAVVFGLLIIPVLYYAFIPDKGLMIKIDNDNKIPFKRCLDCDEVYVKMEMLCPNCNSVESKTIRAGYFRKMIEGEI